MQQCATTYRSFSATSVSERRTSSAYASPKPLPSLRLLARHAEAFFDHARRRSRVVNVFAPSTMESTKGFDDVPAGSTRSSMPKRSPWLFPRLSDPAFSAQNVAQVSSRADMLFVLCGALELEVLKSSSPRLPQIPQLKSLSSNWIPSPLSLSLSWLTTH